MLDHPPDGLRVIAMLDHPPGWSARGDGGEGWIRTSVRLRGQIYSLLPLTTRPPLHRGHAGPHGQARHVAARQSPVNALHLGECHDAPLHSYGVRLRSKIQPSPGWSDFGAGEGNRTLVVSLEGFCSTIELHPQLVEKYNKSRTGKQVAPSIFSNICWNSNSVDSSNRANLRFFGSAS